MRNSRSSRPGNVDAVLDILEGLWGNESDPPRLAHEEPLDGLVLTLLSQNSNDRNRDRGFLALKTVFPSWDSVAETPWEAVAEAIRPAGLANIKSKRMLEILAIVMRCFGEHSLKNLKEKTPEEVREFLRELPGIGAKTVACVMLFDLGMPAFPVDTHIARFCRRMEWVEESLPPEEIQPLMEEWVPPFRYLGGHVNIIEHGRGICSARNPGCERCPLRFYCPGGRKKGGTP